MIRVAIINSSTKTQEGDYIVEAATLFDDITERVIFEQVLGGAYDYDIYADGSFIFSEINFTSLCCILSSLYCLCKIDSYITRESFMLFDADKETKKALLHIAKLYYKIPVGDVSIRSARRNITK